MKYVCGVHGVIDQRPCAQCEAERDRRRRERRKREGTDRDRSRRAQTRRRSIIAVFGNRCAALVDGVRCTEVLAIELHHVDGDRTNDARENLVPVCKHCHLSHAKAPRSAFVQGDFSKLLPRIR